MPVTNQQHVGNIAAGNHLVNDHERDVMLNDERSLSSRVKSIFSSLKYFFTTVGEILKGTETIVLEEEIPNSPHLNVRIETITNQKTISERAQQLGDFLIAYFSGKHNVATDHEDETAYWERDFHHQEHMRA